MAATGEITLYLHGTSYHVEQVGQPTKHYMSFKQGLKAFEKRVAQVYPNGIFINPPA
jgi:hypothetical protein